MAQAIIFGAGKIARGFLGQLLFDAKVSFAFIEKGEALVEQMRARGRYTVNVLGAPEKSEVIDHYEIVSTEDRAGIARAMGDAEVVFTAIGGKNLVETAPVIAYALQCALPRPLNVITCENWKQPADLLKQAVLRYAPEIAAGFAESVVMRSAIEPDARDLQADPLMVNVQNYWRLPVDRDALIAPLPAIAGVEPIGDFRGFLERKFYTYNAANGTVSYLGALLHHQRIADAARDERIAQILELVYLETGRALAAKYGIPLEEQLAFAGTSRAKLRDRVIVDNIERNARDPLRKLGPEDRLVGSARLAMSYHIAPEGLATAIAAAIHYENAQDPAAVQLKSLREARGTGAVLREICKITPDDPLYALVLGKEKELEEKQWIS